MSTTPKRGVREMRDTWIARTPEGDREITLVVTFDDPADSSDAVERDTETEA